MVTAATIHTALLGTKGLERVASTCHANLMELVKQLTLIPGVKRIFPGPCFHETVLQLNQPVNEVLKKLADYPILGGYDLTELYPQLGNSLLVCATEMRTSADINHYAGQLRKIMTT